MRSYTFALSANAGLAVTFPSARIWIDALHIKKAPSYSTVTPEIWARMQTDPAFVGADRSGPDALVFSHCHIDHFTPEIVRAAKSLWKDTKIILPEKYFPDEIYVSGTGMYVDVNDVNLHFIRTHHSTRRHHDKTHYSLMINDCGTRIFMPVDASMSDAAMHYYAVNTEIDIAIVDFIWIMLGKGRDIIEHDIRPKHLLVYHLPFAKDDRGDYRRQTAEAARLLTTIGDVRILDEPFARETIEV